MKEKERLFRVIGGVDGTLLERSERKPRSGAWAGWTAGLAAALGLAVLVWSLAPKSPAAPPDTPPEPPAAGFFDEFLFFRNIPAPSIV